MSQPQNISQVLLFREDDGQPRFERNFAELGSALWAAFQEVEHLYKRQWPDAVFQRHYLSRQPQDFLGPEDYPVHLLPQTASDWNQLWEESRDDHTKTFSAQRLAENVRKLLRRDAADQWLIVVTDQKITPPPDWRYIIWDDSWDGGTVKGGAVVSIPPTDPHYWNERDYGQRIPIIKKRIRAACCCVTGMTLGIERCYNPGCFMYVNVESMTVLDEMVCIGPEHGFDNLSNVGFLETSDPSVPAQVERQVWPIP
jgi:hypothetical protein